MGQKLVLLSCTLPQLPQTRRKIAQHEPTSWTERRRSGSRRCKNWLTRTTIRKSLLKQRKESRKRPRLSRKSRPRPKNKSIKTPRQRSRSRHSRSRHRKRRSPISKRRRRRRKLRRRLRKSDKLRPGQSKRLALVQNKPKKQGKRLTNFSRKKVL